MPTSVEETQVITVAGTKIEMRPLKIKRLKEFMKEFDSLSAQGTTNEASLDILLKCCAIAMRQYHPEFDNVLLLEEELDMQDINKIIEAGTGIRLDSQGNEPKAG